MRISNNAPFIVAVLAVYVAGCSVDPNNDTDADVAAELFDADASTDSSPDEDTSGEDGGDNDADTESHTDESFRCEPPADPDEIWALEAEGITEFRTVSMCEYRGQVLLIVNIAALCGFTPQLGALVELQSRYQDQDFTVLGFYSDEFGNQAGGEAERNACEESYGVNFPVFQIVNVNPPDEHPVFTWLKAESGEGEVTWNFEKFLLDCDGTFIGRWLYGRDA